jgi:sugar phosphate permease
MSQQGLLFLYCLIIPCSVFGVLLIAAHLRQRGAQGNGSFLTRPTTPLNRIIALIIGLIIFVPSLFAIIATIGMEVRPENAIGMVFGFLIGLAILAYAIGSKLPLQAIQYISENLPDHD